MNSTNETAAARFTSKDIYILNLFNLKVTAYANPDTLICYSVPDNRSVD